MMSNNERDDRTLSPLKIIDGRDTIELELRLCDECDSSYDNVINYE